MARLVKSWRSYVTLLFAVLLLWRDAMVRQLIEACKLTRRIQVKAESRDEIPAMGKLRQKWPLRASSYWPGSRLPAKPPLHLCHSTRISKDSLVICHLHRCGQCNHHAFSVGKIWEGWMEEGRTRGKRGNLEHGALWRKKGHPRRMG